ncbi:helix-turn-helix transcriptional regulator [Burkholderia gladioli]|uniref:helix-turn-helix transcriptional regulator n=1 Tax=Burkholderia gladioli TaxID=28095 RepID=UPI003F7A034D
MPLADKVAQAGALAQCEREIALMITDRADLAARVRECHDRYPTAESVAERLHMSVRTFKRRLAEQNTGFRRLLDEAQRFDAVELLRRPDLSLERIAMELGYANPANFTRAFTRWTGVTPSAFRTANPR